MAVSTRRLEFNREKQLVINLITNTEFCTKILPVLKQEYFKSEYVMQIIQWVRVYHDAYGVAPKNHMLDIYEDNRRGIDSSVAEMIGNTLQYLSDIADNEVHNVEFLIDNAVALCEEKHVKLQNEAIAYHLDHNDILAATQAMEDKFTGRADTGTDWHRLDDDTFIRKCIRNMVNQGDIDSAFFRFLGRLGEFIGPIDRGWFIAFLAPAKRGKTTYMLEAAVSGVYQRLNTVVISLEMPAEQLMERYLLLITGQKPGIERKNRIIMTPLMDCKKGQAGECEKEECVSLGSVTDGTGFIPYDENPEWIPCTACRGKKDFEPSSWKVPVKKKILNEGEYLKKVSKFNKFFGKYGRIISKPSKSMTVADLRAEVQHLIDNENFIPDVVVIDYADLILPAQSTGIKRHDLDDIWEDLRAWGQRDRALMISASQTNRLSADADYVKDTHVAEDYSKIAKLDIGIGLCQTDAMKEKGMMNINKIAHRHFEYVQSHVCTVLQEIGHQQAVLDSEFHTY